MRPLCTCAQHIATKKHVKYVRHPSLFSLTSRLSLRNLRKNAEASGLSRHRCGRCQADRSCRKPQGEDLSAVAKKKKTSKVPSSKITQLLDQADAVLGDQPENEPTDIVPGNQPANEPAGVVPGNQPANEPADVVPGTGNQPASERVVKKTGGAPIGGRRHGAKGYTVEELELLNKCMDAAVPIGPQGISDAIILYNRIAKERGWAIRGEKALRQKWDKVREAHTYTDRQHLTITKIPTMQAKSGEDGLRAVIEDAIKIEKKLQVESGVVVIQDPSNPLHWENAYFALTTEDDLIATPPPDIPTDPQAHGLHRNNPGSIIDLTASDDELLPARRSSHKAEVVVKQEIADENVATKATNKGKGAARQIKNGTTNGGVKVAPKSYRHGDGNTIAKPMKAEALLASIADGVSPEAQERRKISRLNSLREALDRDHRDRLTDGIIRGLEAEVQAQRKELNDLRRENAFYRDRATEAITLVKLLSGAGPSYSPIHGPPVLTPLPTMPAFTSDPSLYTVSLNVHQSPEPELEPEGVAGPGPQTMHYRQQDAEADDSEIVEE